jgi:hypothetical protein
MSKLWEKSGDAKDNSDLKEADLSTRAIKKPSIIIISGGPVTDKNQTIISKEIYALNKLLAGHVDIKSPPKIYCWSHKSELSAAFNTVRYNCPPKRRHTTAAQDFAQGVIMPLVSENGQPLPRDEAKKRLRNLTLYTICSGTVVAQEIYNAALEKMKDIGYKPEEAVELLHEVADIAVAPVSSPWKEANRFSTLSLVNSDDGMVNLIHPLRSIFHGARQRLKISKLSATSVLVTAAARRKMWQWRKKEVIEGVWLPRWKLVSHSIPNYINAKDKSSQFSRIVQHALINAVNRKTTVKPLALLKAPATLEACTRDLYQRRIQQAFN